jgi:translocation and assembly module TamA
MTRGRCPVRAPWVPSPRLDPSSRKAVVAAAVMAALAGCATPSTPFEGRPVLKEIRFEGNRSISSGDLESKMATAPTSGFFKKTPRYYDEDLFAIDRKRIERYYNEKGFYEARVVGARTESDDKGRVTLVVSINEGPRAKVKEVRLEGVQNLSSSEQEDVRKQVPLHPGDEFDEDRYEQGKQAIAAQLKEHGFARASATGKVQVVPEEAAAHVTYVVDSGPHFTFGRVLVSGNSSVSTDDIVRATGIDRGEQFRQSRIALAQQRVYNLGAFSGVRVSLEPFSDSPVATVRVTVREAPFQTIRTGLGFSAEQYRYEIPKLHAEYTHRNLFGGLRRLELTTNLGYAFTPTLADPKGIVTVTSAQLVTPSLVFPGLDFIVRGEGAREIQYGFSYDELAGRLALLWRLGPHSVSPSLNYVLYLNSQLDPSLDISQLVGTGGAAAAALLSNCQPTCTLFYPELRYTFDVRDNVVETRKGFYFTISLQQTLKPGTFTYFRIEPEARAYFPLSPSVVAAGRVFWGALIQPAGTPALSSPFQQRFFGGGYNGNRGFPALGQGPRFGAQFNGQGFATTSVPVGGNGEFYVSGELRIATDAILRHTAVVPFLDASRVTVDPLLPFGAPLEVAPGLGLRYLTPFGPIRFDVGFLVKSYTVIAQPPGTPVAGRPPFQPTPVSTSCNSATGTCISQSRFAFHIALGEAY